MLLPDIRVLVTKTPMRRLSPSRRRGVFGRRFLMSGTGDRQEISYILQSAAAD